MEDTNDRIRALEDARRNIEDSMVIMAHLEKRQSEMLKEHATFISTHDREIQEIRQNGKATDERIEKLVSAIGVFIA